MINASVVERQLTPVVGFARARVLASIANGFAGLLADNPISQCLLGAEVFPVLAILYGAGLATLTDIATHTCDSPGCVAHENAQAVLAEVATVLAAVQQPDPNPEPADPMESIESLRKQLVRDLLLDEQAPSAVLGNDVE